MIVLLVSINGCVYIAVIHAASEGCRGSVSVEATRGVRLISSDYKLHGHVASVRCPVDIQATSGQRINITVHNFGQPTKASRKHRERGRCPHHLVIADGQDRSNVSLCGRRRVSQAYLSRNSRIELYFAVADHAEVSSPFLVSFDGRIYTVCRGELNEILNSLPNENRIKRQVIIMSSHTNLDAKLFKHMTHF